MPKIGSLPLNIDFKNSIIINNKYRHVFNAHPSLISLTPYSVLQKILTLKEQFIGVETSVKFLLASFGLCGLNFGHLATLLLFLQAWLRVINGGGSAEQFITVSIPPPPPYFPPPR